jgi:hypothetical protein
MIGEDRVVHDFEHQRDRTSTHHGHVYGALGIRAG